MRSLVTASEVARLPLLEAPWAFLAPLEAWLLQECVPIVPVEFAAWKAVRLEVRDSSANCTSASWSMRAQVLSTLLGRCIREIASTLS